MALWYLGTKANLARTAAAFLESLATTNRELGHGEASEAEGGAFSQLIRESGGGGCTVD